MAADEKITQTTSSIVLPEFERYDRRTGNSDS